MHNSVVQPCTEFQVRAQRGGGRVAWQAANPVQARVGRLDYRVISSPPEPGHPGRARGPKSLSHIDMAVCNYCAQRRAVTGCMVSLCGTCHSTGLQPRAQPYRVRARDGLTGHRQVINECTIVWCSPAPSFRCVRSVGEAAWPGRPLTLCKPGLAGLTIGLSLSSRNLGVHAAPRACDTLTWLYATTVHRK